MHTKIYHVLPTRKFPDLTLKISQGPLQQARQTFTIVNNPNVRNISPFVELDSLWLSENPPKNYENPDIVMVS